MERTENVLSISPSEAHRSLAVPALLMVISILLLFTDSTETGALPLWTSPAALLVSPFNSVTTPMPTTICYAKLVVSPWLLEMCVATVPLVELELARYCPRCSGYFALRLDSGSPTCGAFQRTKPISFNVETDAIVRNELGPHELLALIEGPERAWLRPEHMGNCSYRLPFRTQVPGKYRLHILQVRSGFAAMDETIDAFPPIDAVYITGYEGLRFSLGETALGANHDEHASAAALNAVLSRSGLPRCASGNAAGRFVFTGNLQALYNAPPRAAHVLASARLIDRTNYTTHTDQFEWRPYSCALARFEPVMFRAATAGLRIDFFGDSHVRLLFSHILHTCNVSTHALSKTKPFCIEQGTMPQCMESSICYIGKHEGSDFINYDNDSGHGPKRDVLIINVGNHPASKVHRSLQDYSAEVQGLLNLFGVAADSSPQERGLKAALWLASPPITVSDQEFLKFYKDWRTTHRLRLFNDAALNETLRFLGPRTGTEGLYAFVDLFPLAMAAIQDAPDFAHLAGLPSALNGVLD